MFEISFVRHPYHGATTRLIEDIPDGEVTEQRGIIKSIDRKRSVKGTFYYVMSIIGPLEVIYVTLWNEMYERNKQFLHKGTLVRVCGKRGWRGITASFIEDETEKVRKLYELRDMD